MNYLYYYQLQGNLEIAELYARELKDRAKDKVNKQQTTGEALDHYHREEIALDEIHDYIVYVLDAVKTLRKEDLDFEEKQD